MDKPIKQLLIIYKKKFIFILFCLLFLLAIFGLIIFRFPNKLKNNNSNETIYNPDNFNFLIVPSASTKDYKQYIFKEFNLELKLPSDVYIVNNRLITSDIKLAKSNYNSFDKDLSYLPTYLSFNILIYKSERNDITLNEFKETIDILEKGGQYYEFKKNIDQSGNKVYSYRLIDYIFYHRDATTHRADIYDVFFIDGNIYSLITQLYTDSDQIVGTMKVINGIVDSLKYIGPLKKFYRPEKITTKEYISAEWDFTVNIPKNWLVQEIPYNNRAGFYLAITPSIKRLQGKYNDSPTLYLELCPEENIDLKNILNSACSENFKQQFKAEKFSYKYIYPSKDYFSSAADTLSVNSFQVQSTVTGQRISYGYIKILGRNYIFHSDNDLDPAIINSIISSIKVNNLK